MSFLIKAPMLKIP